MCSDSLFLFSFVRAVMQGETPLHRAPVRPRQLREAKIKLHAHTSKGGDRRKSHGSLSSSTQPEEKCAPHPPPRARKHTGVFESV